MGQITLGGVVLLILSTIFVVLLAIKIAGAAIPWSMVLTPVALYVIVTAGRLHGELRRRAEARRLD